MHASRCPGIEADIVDEHGNSVTRPDAGGYLVIKQAVAVDAAHHLGRQRSATSPTTGRSSQNRYYLAGDGAHRDKDGYFWIMGRIDDVLNVVRPSPRHDGDRVGAGVASDASPRPPWSASRTTSRANRCSRSWCSSGRARPATGAAFAKELRDWVGKQIGAIAKPDDIRFADNLPKTRSGKIMRRLLRSIARGEEITQDVSTLENPAILEQLRGIDAGPARRPRRGEARPRAPSPPGAPAARQRRKARPAASKRPAKARAKPARRPAKRSARTLTRRRPARAGARRRAAGRRRR